jgi:hypothetical protein
MLEIRTAAELIDPELEARWAARRADRASDLMQYILRTFVERGGPIAIDEVVAACPDEGPDAVRRALVALDEQDLIQIRDGRIEIAYPFSASPTPFVVRLDGGRERYACCAIDARGMAPMLGETVGIRSRCHHPGEQAVGTPKARQIAASYLRRFVEDVKASGLVAEAIARNAVKGVSVAPPVPGPG